MPLSRLPSPIVLDANLALYALNASAPQQEAVLALFARWREEGRGLIAPALWRLEVASGLRKNASLGFLSDPEAEALLDLFLGWEVRVYPNDAALVWQAFEWAKRIGERVIYDSVYLALAEKTGGEFWTADARFARRARKAGAEFVKLLETTR